MRCVACPAASARYGCRRLGGCGSAGPARCLIHDPDDFMGQAADDAYPALADLRAQGVVRAIGAGMNAAAPLAWLIERCDLDCVLVAGGYTLLDDSAADSLLPLCLRRGVAVLAGGVFNSGILAGPGDGATYDYAPVPPAVLDRARWIRGRLRPVQRPAGRGLAALHRAPPGGDGRGRGRPHAGRNSRRRLLPLNADTRRAVGRAEPGASALRSPRLTGA